MNAEKFWYSWLKITLFIIIAAGVTLSILSRTQALDYLIKHLTHLYFKDHIPDSSNVMSQGWLLGILGIILAVWGTIVLYLTFSAIKNKKFWSWNFIFYSLVFWVVLDVSVSLYFHAILNIFIDTIFFLQIAAPLLYLRNSVKQKIEAMV